MTPSFAAQFWPALLSAVLAAIIVAVVFWFVALPGRRAKKIMDDAAKKAEAASDRAEGVRRETSALIRGLQEQRRQDWEQIVSLDKSYKESVELTTLLINQVADLNDQVEALREEKKVKEEIIEGLRRQVKHLQEDKNRLLKEAKAAKGGEADCQAKLAELAAKLQTEIATVRAEVQAVAG